MSSWRPSVLPEPDGTPMSYSRLVERTWAENLLFSVLLELTHRCNLDCSLCYNDRGLRGRLLTRDQYFRLFEDLADLQVMHLTFSGGEPLIHPDFLALGRKARELGFVVRIKTNGHILREDLAKKIKEEVDPFILEVSLHGATAETHDRQSRVPGSFDRLIKNLRVMVSLGLRVKINGLLTAWNEHELRSMFDLADRLGLPIQVDSVVTPRDDGDRSPLEIAASKEAVSLLLRLQSERLGSGQRTGASVVAMGAERRAEADSPARGCTKNCGAGSSTLCIDPFGEVYPCVQWRRQVGSLHQQSIKQIWSDSRVLRETRAETIRVKRVVDRAGLVAFCPGVAELETGSSTGLYRGATRRHDVPLEQS